MHPVFAARVLSASSPTPHQEMAWQEVPQGENYKGKKKKWVGVGEDAGKKPKYQSDDPNQKKPRTSKQPAQRKRPGTRTPTGGETQREPVDTPASPEKKSRKAKVGVEEAAEQLHGEYEAIKARIESASHDEIDGAEDKFMAYPATVLASVLKRLGFPTFKSKRYMARVLKDNLVSIRSSVDAVKGIDRVQAASAPKKQPVEMEVVADEAVGQAEDALGQLPPESFNEMRRRLGETAGGKKSEIKRRMAGKIYEEFEVWRRGQRINEKGKANDQKRDTRSWGRFLGIVLGGALSGLISATDAAAQGVGSLIEGVKRRI